MLGRVFAKLVFCSLIAGCGADDEPLVDAGTDAEVPTDVGGSDDSGDAADAQDAGEDAATDARDCTPSTFACAAACAFNFSSFAADRDGLVTIGLATGAAGPIEITSLAVVDSSPKASFSSSFVDYIERISDGAWVANDSDTAFDVSGGPIEMPAGSTFEVDVRFRSIEDGTGCPGTDDCGAVVLGWQSCGVSGEPIRLPIRR